VSRLREWALIAVVAAIAGAGGYAFHYWRISPEAPHAAGGGHLMAAHFPDLAGERQGIEQWRGKVLVVNFWATWCTPCREEIPVFVSMQKQYGPQGLQFVGIAIDQADKVQAFASEFGMNFPVLLGGLDAVELARTLGNKAGVLPYTVVIGRDGRVVSTKVGAVKEPQLTGLIAPLL
jgi:thiol-disulfide isomerase/thioredoxin